MKSVLVFEIRFTFICQPPRWASTHALVVEQILLSEIVQSLSSTSVREIEHIRDFNCREKGIFRLLKKPENFGIRDRFFSPRHYRRVYFEGSYHHRVDSNLEKTGFTGVLSFVERTKSFTETIQNYGSNLADPSLLDGSILKIERTPLLGQRARVDFRDAGTKAMYDDTLWGLESPAMTAVQSPNCPLSEAYHLTNGGRR